MRKIGTPATDLRTPPEAGTGAMATIRIVITLKPGVLDAPGQAVQQGLHALGYDRVAQVRVGRYLEVTVPHGTTAAEIHQMCDRFLANPLIETWRIDVDQTPDPASSRQDPGPAIPSLRESR